MKQIVVTAKYTRGDHEKQVQIVVAVPETPDFESLRRQYAKDIRVREMMAIEIRKEEIPADFLLPKGNRSAPCPTDDQLKSQGIEIIEIEIRE